MNSETPNPPLDAGGETERKKALLEEAKALTSIVRTGWIGLLGGCLYTWLTLGSLQDMELFVVGQSVALPIVGGNLSTRGYFIFAPFLLLALGSYVHMMFAQLLECYARLLRISGSSNKMIDGLPVDERVEPWFLTILIKTNIQPTDWIRRLFAELLLWWAAPITIFAVCYRYLRAGDLSLSLLHGLVITVAFFLVVFIKDSAISHLKHVERGARSGMALVAKFATKAVAIIACTFFLFVVAATHSPNMGFRVPPSLDFLSPHARLYGAELSQRPDEWDILKWQSLLKEIDTTENCFPEPIDLSTAPACMAKDALDTEKRVGPDALAMLLGERDKGVQDVNGARLGHEPAPQRAGSPQPAPPAPSGNGQVYESVCKVPAPELVSTARNLGYADLRNAYLVNANLVCARLVRADLRGVDLTAAKLGYARISEADLTRARLEAADLNHAMLDGAVLIEAHIDERTMLAGTDLEGANLSHADLFGARLGGTKMSNTNLTDTDLRMSVGGPATSMSNAKLVGTDLRGAILSGTDFRRAVFDDAKANGATFFGATLENAILANVARDSSTSFFGADFTDAVLDDSGASSSSRTGKEPGSDFNSANFVRTHFKSADFFGAGLAYTNIQEVTVDSQTVFAMADFTGAALRDVDLSKTDFTEEQARQAFSDASTILPDGVKPPLFWPVEALEEEEFYGLWQGWRRHCNLAVEPSGAVRTWLQDNNYNMRPWTDQAKKDVCPSQLGAP